MQAQTPSLRPISTEERFFRRGILAAATALQVNADMLRRINSADDAVDIAAFEMCAEYIRSYYRISGEHDERIGVYNPDEVAR